MPLGLARRDRLALGGRTSEEEKEGRRREVMYCEASSEQEGREGGEREEGGV